MLEIKIHKFGGASLKDVPSLRQCGKIVKKEKPNIVVVSAIGKTTNALENVARGIIENRTDLFEQSLELVRKYNEPIIKELFKKRPDVPFKFEEIMKYLTESFVGINKCNSFEMVRDQLMAQGEIISSRIVSAFLADNDYSNKLIPAKNFIRTNLDFGNAIVSKEESMKTLFDCGLIYCLRKEIPVITQGFIAGARLDRKPEFYFEGYTTLGREGSDYSAALIASLLVDSGILKAEEVTEVVLWKDVPGVGLENPKKAGKDAKFFKTLSYDHFQEMIEPNGTAYGLVHPKTLKELKDKEIPLRVKNFWKPDLPGTLISKSKRNSGFFY